MMRLVFVALWMISVSAAAETAVQFNRFGMPFVQIPAGNFMMGTQDLGRLADEIGADKSANISDERPPHHVAFSKAFWLGQTEVTQSQWIAVMGTKPGPDAYWQREDWQNLPVVSISWDRAQNFLAELNKADPKHHYRLPTEAEWEYAARAGNNTLRPFPQTELDENAWYIGNSGDKPQPVASKKVNAFGLYDMLGNAWEWVADFYAKDYYKHSPKQAPQGPNTGTRRVRRGGSYHCPAHLVRPAYRAADLPEKSYSVLSFRVVMEAVKPAS